MNSTTASSEYLAARLERDTQYLHTMFGDPGRMEGTIVVLKGENGYNNYSSMIGDPMHEDTLIVEDNNNNIMLFFNHITFAAAVTIWPNVSIINDFSYTVGCLIHKKRKIANVPSHIMTHVLRISYDDADKKLADMKLDDSFFDRNYTRGGFIPIKSVRQHPEWNPAFENTVEVKRMAISQRPSTVGHAGVYRSMAIILMLSCVKYSFNDYTFPYINNVDINQMWADTEQMSKGDHVVCTILSVAMRGRGHIGFTRQHATRSPVPQVSVLGIPKFNTQIPSYQPPPQPLKKTDK